MYTTYHHNRKLLLVAVSLAYVVVVFFAINTLTELFVAQTIRNSEERIQRKLSLARSKMEAAIFTDTYLGDSLATVLTIDPNFTISNWTLIASKLLLKARYVRNVSIIQDSIITHVYPREGNEQALGLNFAKRPEQYTALMLAKRLQTVHISGPINLVQGGKGIIARYPIFSDFPINKHYWGSVSVVMDYDELLNSSGLLSIQGANIAMRKREIDGKEGKVFHGESYIFSHPDLIYPINLPSGKWLLAADYQLNHTPEIASTRFLVRSISIFSAILIYISLALLVRNYQYAHRDSMHDELTKLPNRRFILGYLSQLLGKTDRSISFAILNIDINDFKEVNDTLGHEAGDFLLKYVAKMLVKSVRTSDRVARFGGDEFVVVLQDLPDANLIGNIIQKLRNTFTDNQLQWHQTIIQPTFSIGWVHYDGQNTTLTELLAQADQNMYRDKKTSKKQSPEQPILSEAVH